MCVLAIIILTGYFFYPDAQSYLNSKKEQIQKNKNLDITRQLLNSEYKKRNIIATNDEIESFKNNLIKIIGSKEVLQEKSKALGISEADLEKLIAEQIKQEKLLKSLGLKEIKNSQVEKFYKENRKLFEIPERFQIYQIVIENKNEALINEIKAKVNPANFVQLAKKYSKDEKTASIGGNLGYVAKGEIPAQVYVQLTSQKVETISSPIKTPQGTYFVYLKDKTASKTISYVEAKEDIRQYLYRKEKAELLQNFLEGVKAKEKLKTVSAIGK